MIGAVVVFGAPLARAQSPSARPRPAPLPLQHAVEASGKQMDLRAGFDRASVAPGASVGVIVDATPRARMHVYAPGQPGYLVVDWKIDPSARIKTVAPVYPAAKTLFLEAIAEAAKIYDGPFRVTQRVSVAASADVRRLVETNNQPLTLTATLAYQACDDRVCYVPDRVRVCSRFRSRTAALLRVVEISRPRRARKILAGHPDKRAREVRLPGDVASSDARARIELLRRPRPRAAGQAENANSTARSQLLRANRLMRRQESESAA